MKLKYIFSMVAGLFVMTTTSCSEKTTVEAVTEDSATVATTESAPATAASKGAVATSAYYVMFKGDGGWGIGNRASSALKKVDGIDSIVLSGLRATVKMKDGAVLDEKIVSDALTKNGLTFISKSAVADDAPKVVYVLDVAGVGWSDSEEKARVALNGIAKVTNVYIGKKTEVWMSEDSPLDKEVVSTMLDELGFSVDGMEKTDKSAL